MGPTVRKKGRNGFALSSAIIWFDFHLSKAQGVVETSPIIPLHPVTVERVIASQIEAVQVHGDKYGTTRRLCIVRHKRRPGLEW